MDAESKAVADITDLLLAGEESEIVSILRDFCPDNFGIKRSRQLLREAQDRAIARTKRLAGGIGVTLDEWKMDSE